MFLYKNTIYCLSLCLFVLLFSTNTSYSQGIKKVVIDAGHGGHDPGCHGAKSKEKEVCLAMALKLGKFISENYKDIQVIYTRSTDVFVELHERANIANKNKADLFICIHANAGQKTAFGSETYVMGLHKTNDNLSVAKRENSVILLEENYTEVYEGFNPNSDEDIIALTLMQSTYLDQSVDIASKIQTNFEKLGRKNRGVKQAGFLVLYKTAMPSVLIETGFLSNQEEENFLADEKNQDKMAQSMFTAFKQYKDGIDKRISSGTKPSQAPTTSIPAPAPKTIPVVEKDSVLTPDASKENKTDSVNIQKTVDRQIVNKEATTDTLLIQSVVKNQAIEIAAPIEKLKEEVKTVDAPKEKLANDRVVFRVQIVSSPQKTPKQSAVFKGLQNIYEYVDQDQKYKYTVGESDNPEELVFLQNSLRQKGFKDAFVIAMQFNKRISMQEARSKIKK